MIDIWDQNWNVPTTTLDLTVASRCRRRAEVPRQTGASATYTPVVTTLRGYGYRLELGTPAGAPGVIPGTTP